MKLSIEIHTLAKRFGDFKAVEMIKNAGFDALDYSYYWRGDDDEKILGDTYKEYAENLKKRLDDIGITCNQAHAPFSLAYGAEFNLRDPEYLKLVRSIESAAVLGAENIIVHSISVPKEVDFYEYNIGYYKSLIPYCEKFVINVAVENLFSRDKRNRIIGKIGTPEELNDIVEKIDSPYIVACVDIGHAALTGYEPEDFLAKVNPKILKALHVHDNNFGFDDHTLPYNASFDWDAFADSVKTIGYQGDLTFEIFSFLDKFPDSVIPSALNLAESCGRHLIALCVK